MPVSTATASLSCSVGALEPRADGAMADQPDDEQPEPVEQRQQAEIDQRAQSLLGVRCLPARRCRSRAQDPAHDRLGCHGHGGNDAEEKEKAERTVVRHSALSSSKPRHRRELPTERRQRPSRAAPYSVQHDRELVWPFAARDS